MNKSSKHWYPRYSGDYRTKTAGLSLIQHGAYTLLLDEYYNTEKPLSANAVQLHRICSALALEEQEAINFILDNFFIKTEEGYKNKRVEEELAKRIDISDKRKKAANSRHANVGANAYTPTPTPTSTSKAKSTSKTQEGVLKNKGGIKYDVEHHLNDTGRAYAKLKAPGWDMYQLVKIYNDGIANGKREPPDNANSAFPAWCEKYTKGKQL